MPGYTSPYVLMQFPDLGDDVSVLMRNPQLLPPREITPRDVPTDDKGQPLDPDDAQKVMYEVFARLIVAWKVYDASQTPPLEISEDADPVALFESLGSGDAQPRIGPINVDNVARLPMRIISRMMDEVNATVSPQ
ncbi:hypothetical protein GCM10010331_49070 [Streptomyces xanthochromogenes]|uniref:hypothetical protein n=1 Tax=Streptomyces xanthochromogenes TaxID=67384 RepID=UPI001673494A|nr:hypothetical protein [Streptomyces xanthochromogenes]GHB55430.1 hypothetical protein GCM10010331_49070 [Streptomyces xanthochromogenes]